FRDNFLCVINHGGVVGMLLRKLTQHLGRHFVLVCDGLLIGVRKIFFVNRKRRFVDGGLCLLQIGLCPFHDFFHRQIRRQGEAQFFPVLLCAETEVAIGAGEQIVLEPFFVILQRRSGFVLQRGQLLFHLRRLIEKRCKVSADE